MRFPENLSGMIRGKGEEKQQHNKQKTPNNNKNSSGRNT